MENRNRLRVICVNLLRFLGLYTTYPLRSIVWNLQRYSSYTYIERMLKLVEAYVPGYEKDVISSGSYPGDIEELRRMYKNIAEITNALKLIRNGYPNEGYVNILYQNAFKEFFSGRMLQENDYESIGYRRDGSVGLFSWVEKAIDMYYYIASTWVTIFSNLNYCSEYI